jgi:hypothetical protein
MNGTLKHTKAREWLTPLADGALPAEVRGSVEAHLAACAEFSRELAELRRLNLVLSSFTSAPPVAFGPFWHRLRATLPAPKEARRPIFVFPRRAALAFAMAALAALMVGGTAFASESALPDNPLYSVKRVGEDVRLTFAFDQQSRVALEIQLAGERLRDAQAMAAGKKAQLAASSLRDFNALLRRVGPALRQPGADNTVKQLQSQLAAVQQINSENGANDDVSAEVVEGQSTLNEDQQGDQGTFGNDSETLLDPGKDSNQNLSQSGGASVSGNSGANESLERSRNQRSDENRPSAGE